MKRRAAWLIVPLLLLGGVGALLMVGDREISGAAELPKQLGGRGRVAVVGARQDLLRLDGAGTSLFLARDLPEVAGALGGSDPEALLAAMRSADVAGLLADGRDGGDPSPEASLASRLGAYGHVPGLNARYLAPAAALYLPSDVSEIRPPLDDALSTVARGILGGARPPRVSSFPEPLRRMRNVEVMVMLRENGQARLWRSARGSSVARALVTASVVARQRWEERQQAMGGPLDGKLRHLDVEVMLLEEDGTLGVRSPAFVERVFTPEHGVAYERRGAWRYLLPEATRAAGDGSAVAAYQQLFLEHGLEAEALERTDLRLYRLVARPLARSPAPSASPSGSTLLEELGLAGGGDPLGLGEAAED